MGTAKYLFFATPLGIILATINWKMSQFVLVTLIGGAFFVFAAIRFRRSISVSQI